MAPKQRPNNKNIQHIHANETYEGKKAHTENFFSIRSQMSCNWESWLEKQQ